LADKERGYRVFTVRLMRFAIMIELIVVALLHHCDDRPIASMAGRIIAAEFRRIEPRRHASVEKEGIPAAEAVAEKTGKLVKAHPVFGDDEMHLGRTRYADSVPHFAIG
jgi:hypothetical protein